MSKPRVYLTMIGAAGNEVTGSCTLLKIVLGKKVRYGLIDVGIVQGQSEYRNYQYPIDATKLDFVIITHAHADHLLACPLLKGFKGKVYGTASAFAQGKELLYDAAFNYERAATEEMGIPYSVYRELCSELEALSHKNNHNSLERYHDLNEQLKEIKNAALYTQRDVDEICKRFCAVIPYHPFIISDGIDARLIPSTHQNGSVTVELYVGNYGEDSVNISFSGDIGPKESYLYRYHSYDENRLINYCIMEALHGLEYRYETPEDTYNKLKKLVLYTVEKGRTLILVGFALDRIAMIVRTINRIFEEEKIDIPVYLDSPLAYRELTHYIADYNAGNSLWFKDFGRAPFNLDRIIVVNKRSEHLAAMRDKNAKIIITASAFGEGGRVVDYFDHYIQDENAIFVFTGWLSPDCSSNILHSAKKMEHIVIHDCNYVKHCETYQFSGFTSHGYFEEFEDYLNRFPNCKGLILNHAERDPKNAVKDKLSEEYDFEIYVPEMYDSEQQSFYMLTAEGVTEFGNVDGYGEFKDVLECNVMYRPPAYSLRIED